MKKEDRYGSKNKTGEEHEILSWIQEGMPVFDRDGKKIGKVRRVQFGDRSGENPVAKPEEFYHLPSEVQIRLARDGFIQIDAGFFAHDRLVSPDEIAQVSDNGLILNVTGDSLVIL